MRTIPACIFVILFVAKLFFSPLSAQNWYEANLRTIWRQGHQAAYEPGSGFHTSLRPYSLVALNDIINLDSLYAAERVGVPGGFWGGVLDRVWNRSLLVVEKDDFSLHINPLFDFGYGMEAGQDEPTWVNTRGFLAEGTVGEKIGFSTRFYENQGRFPQWIRSFVGDYGVLPGQGSTRRFKETAYDYNRAEGHLSYTPSRHFDFRLGHGKHFIGDGYRSLLLSDNAFPYPYLQGMVQVWRLKYTVIYTEMQNRRGFLPGDWSDEWQDLFRSRLTGNPRKHMTLHYLTINATDRFSLGLFEGVIWAKDSPDGYRGFDVNYLNPVIFFRPVEFSIGSPDKMILGANASYRLGRGYVLYGQFVLDEFKIDHVRDGNGWHGNKSGYQLGAKAYEAFGIPNLFLLAEYNRVRPFTYSHWQPLTQYSHYNQPLAHPLGANFHETILQASYRFRRLYFHYHYSYALFGRDEQNENYGGNIFKDYRTHSKEFGNYIGQGLEVRRHFQDLGISLLLNPKTNMNISLGYMRHAERSPGGDHAHRWFYVGFRTSLDNYYYDF